MSDDVTDRRSRRGEAVPHDGKMVFDVTTRKWYEVRESYTPGAGRDVQLQPPGGYDTRRVDTKDFVSEVGSRLLLKRVARSLGDNGDWYSEVGSMSYTVFTDELGLPAAVVDCPDCGATCTDGQVRMHHAFAGFDYPDEGPVLHCRQCRGNWGVRPAVIDRD